MPILKLGDSGDRVKALQQALARAGCNPGAVDGVFGIKTAFAVKAYQSTHNLPVDGEPGPKTMASLDPWMDDSHAAPTAVQCSDDTARFTVEVVSSMFPGTPVSNIRRNLQGVLDGLRKFDLIDEPMVLMALATIRAETASFVPVMEGVSKYNTSPGGHAFDLYDERLDLGNHTFPDGSQYPGRGYVQLTGKYNYALYGPKVGVNLIKSPKLACDPKYAGLILAAFLDKHSDSIRTALAADDMRKARRLVNGGSHGIGEFTDAYRRGQRALA